MAIFNGTSGNDTIYGSISSDTLIGSKGDDQLFGQAGNDTYQFSKGDGSDFVQDYDPTAGNFDVIVFTDVRSTDITSLTQTRFDLTIKYGTVDQVLVNYYFTPNFLIEQIKFSDGVTWGVDDIKSRTVQNGTVAADTLQGYTRGPNVINGLSGDDTIYGGDGNDVLDGGDGNDKIYGGPSGNKVLRGGAGNDVLDASSGAGNNILEGGAGNDTIVGGTGMDTAIFTGKRSGYTITVGNVTRVADKSGLEGIDTLAAVERLQFSDAKVAIDLAPGGNAAKTAQFFGLLGFSFLSQKSTVGNMLEIFDLTGISLSDAFRLVLSSGLVNQLAGGTSDTAFVKLIYRNLVGSEATDAAAATLAGQFLKDSGGAYSRIDFLNMSAGTDANLHHVGLIGNTGISVTGLEYI